MRRLHLFEVMDLDRCPQWLRRMETEYIQAAESLFDTVSPIVERVSAVLRQTGHGHIVDLCSGSGGPVLRLLDHLEGHSQPIRAILTDRYPQVSGWKELSARSGGRVSYVEEPVQATAVPPGLHGLRTLFDGLHHLRPDEVRAVLASAVEAGMPILALETTQRSWSSLASMVLVPAAVWSITPAIRPWSLRRFAATYVVPVVPTVMTWDGVVSTLRTYTLEELQDFAQDLDAPGWTWDIGETRQRGVPLCWILGTPP